MLGLVLSTVACNRHVLFSRFPVFWPWVMDWNAGNHLRKARAGQGRPGGADYGQGPGPLPAGIYKLSCQMMPSVAGEIGDCPPISICKYPQLADGRPRGGLHHSSERHLSRPWLSTRLADRLLQ